MSSNPLTGIEEQYITEGPVGLISPSNLDNRLICLYDFAKHGGAIGRVALPNGRMPKGAVITNSYMRVTTVPTSGGAATIAIECEAIDDIQAAALISGAPWSTTGLKDTTAPEPGTESTYILTTTATRKITVVIAAAALTAGRFYVIVEYDVTE
jgi:hypothetical protein